MEFLDRPSRGSDPEAAKSQTGRNSGRTPAKDGCQRLVEGGQEQEEARVGPEGDCDIEESNRKKKINIFIHLSIQ